MENYCGKCGSKLDARTKLCPQCNQVKISQSKKKRRAVIVAVAILGSVGILASVLLWAVKNREAQSQSDTYREYNSFMEGFTDILVTNEESAIKAIASIAEPLGIKNAAQEFKIESVQQVKEDRFYRAQQMYQSIPVYGRSVVVSADKSGKAIALTSNYIKMPDNLNIVPTATKEEIIKSIKKYLSADQLPDLSISNDDLIIYSLGDEVILAYLLAVDAYSTIIVNADSAEVVQYNALMNDIAARVVSRDGTVSSTGWQNDDGSYRLYNDEHKIEIFDVTGIDTVIDKKGRVHEDFRKYGINALSSKNNQFDKNAVLILNDVINVSDYYKTLGEKGFDQVHVAINDSFKYGLNARGGSGLYNGLNCAVMLFGTEFNFDEKDVIGHEYTHAVSKKLIGWSGDDIQTAALNEAYSDILGILYENNQTPDWRIIHLSKLLRDLAEPAKSNSYDNIADIDESDGHNEYTLSTIISHAAYLMWCGIDGRENRRIDAKSLSELWYRSMLLLQSNADFTQCRNAVELSARIMLRNQDLTEAQLRTIITAFENVGIENAAFTYSYTVQNSFNLSVLNSKGTENIHFRLEVIQMPVGKVEHELIQDDRAKTVVDKTAITGRQSLELPDGTYLLRITEVSDLRSIANAINIKIVVNGQNADSKDEVIVNADFADVIVVVLDRNPTDLVNEPTPSSETDQSGAEIIPPESAVDIYMSYKNIWMENPQSLPKSEYGYCLLDLDFDGVLELVNSVNDGSEYYSYNKFYKLNSKTSSVEEFFPPLVSENCGVDYYFESDAAQLLKNKSDGTLFYIFDDFGKAFAGGGYTDYYQVSMEGNTIKEAFLWGETWQFDENDLSEIITEYKFGDIQVSEAEYRQKTEEFYAENETQHLTWKRVCGEEFDKASEDTQRELLLDAYCSFSYDGFSLERSSGARSEIKESPLTLYVPILTEAIEVSGGMELDSFGMLRDVNDDGIEELFLLYSDGDVEYYGAVYTIKDGYAVPVIPKTLAGYWAEGGPNTAIGVASVDGKNFVALRGGTAGEMGSDEHWYLYEISEEFALSEEVHFEILGGEYDSEMNAFTNMEYSIVQNNQQITKTEFDIWKSTLDTSQMSWEPGNGLQELLDYCRGNASAYPSGDDPKDTTQIPEEPTEPEPTESLYYDVILATGYDSEMNYYQLVGTETEDFSGTQVKLGVIKNNHWAIPLSADMPFVGKDGLLCGHQGNYTGSIYDIPYYIEIKYIGCGCFYYNYGSYDGGATMINANTGAAYYNDYGYPLADYGESYTNNRDNIVIVKGYSGNLHTINTENMEMSCEIPIPWDKFGKIYGYSNGLFACLDGSPGYYTSAQGFYDLNGNRVIDLSKYDLTQLSWKADSVYDENYNTWVHNRTPMVFADDGTCSFVTRNDQGNLYTIKINKDGEVVNSVKESFSLQINYIRG